MLVIPIWTCECEDCPEHHARLRSVIIDGEEVTPEEAKHRLCGFDEARWPDEPEEHCLIHGPEPDEGRSGDFCLGCTFADQQYA